MKEEQLRKLISEVAEDLVPSETNLHLPSLRAHFEKAQVNSANRLSAQPQKTKVRWSLVIPSIVLLLLAVFILTPAGNAWAKNLLSFFINADNDTALAPTQAPIAWVFVTPDTTLAENQQKRRSHLLQIAVMLVILAVPRLICNLK